MSKLSVFESVKIAPFVGKYLNTQKRLTSSDISQLIYAEFGVMLKGAKIRALIHFLRLQEEGKLPIVADVKGYYRTSNKQILHRYITTLQGRINEIEEIKKSIIEKL